MRFKELKNDKFIMIFSHSNYTQNFVSGTEKVIMDLQKIYNKQKIDVIHVFPLSKFDNFIGMNINGKFYGVYKIFQIIDIFNLLQSKNKQCDSVMIHHLKGYNLDSLGDVLKRMNAKIVLAIHDFYLVCNTFNFLKNKCQYCGVTKPTKKKCEDCYNFKSIVKFEKERDCFLKKIDDNLIKIIFPSEFCKEKWLEFFPEYNDRAIIREHLVYRINEKKVQHGNEKIKIAYIGRKNSFKGIDNWNEIIKDERLIKKFDFFYFGVDIEKNENIKEIYTNNAKAEKSMFEALTENNIDIVILWSIIPETFSFTYFEASYANCLVITNKDSGNIMTMVNKVNNGWIFNNKEEEIEFLYKLERKDIENFNTIDNVQCNKSIDEFKIYQEFFENSKNKCVHRNMILTFLFFIIKLKGKR